MQPWSRYGLVLTLQGRREIFTVVIAWGTQSSSWKISLLYPAAAWSSSSREWSVPEGFPFPGIQSNYRLRTMTFLYTVTQYIGDRCTKWRRRCHAFILCWVTPNGPQWEINTSQQKRLLSSKSTDHTVREDKLPLLLGLLIGAY